MARPVSVLIYREIVENEGCCPWWSTSVVLIAALFVGRQTALPSLVVSSGLWW